MRIPRSIGAGRRSLVLGGAASDDPELDVAELAELLGLPGEDAEREGSDPEVGPRTLEALARDVRDIGRWDGVTATFAEPGEQLDQRAGPDGDPALRPRRVFRDPALRLAGRARIPIVVR